MIPMLIEPLHIRPGTPTLLRRRCMFSPDTERINTRGVIGQDRFEANVTLPVGAVIIDIPEALASLQTQRAQPYVAGIGTGAAIVLAMHVEGVQMFIAPVESDLEHGVEVRQGRVATDEQTAPDEWTDLAQDDAELIDAGWFNRLIHAQSVPRRALRFKMSPRYLAVSSGIAPGNKRDRMVVGCLATKASFSSLEWYL